MRLKPAKEIKEIPYVKEYKQLATEELERVTDLYLTLFSKPGFTILDEQYKWIESKFTFIEEDIHRFDGTNKTLPPLTYLVRYPCGRAEVEKLQRNLRKFHLTPLEDSKGTDKPLDIFPYDILSRLREMELLCETLQETKITPKKKQNPKRRRPHGQAKARGTGTGTCSAASPLRRRERTYVHQERPARMKMSSVDTDEQLANSESNPTYNFDYVAGIYPYAQDNSQDEPQKKQFHKLYDHRMSPEESTRSLVNGKRQAYELTNLQCSIEIADMKDNMKRQSENDQSKKIEKHQSKSEPNGTTKHNPQEVDRIREPSYSFSERPCWINPKDECYPDDQRLHEDGADDAKSNGQSNKASSSTVREGCTKPTSEEIRDMVTTLGSDRGHTVTFDSKDEDSR